MKNTLLEPSYSSFSEGICRIPVIYLRLSDSKREMCNDMKVFDYLMYKGTMMMFIAVNNDRVVYTSELPGLMGS